MTTLDRFIQSWRIRKAKPFIRRGARVLDISASDAPLFRKIPNIGSYIGIDPDLPGDQQIAANARLVKGFFPECIAGEEKFDCITVLAVLEHIPTNSQPQMASDCAAHLKPGGCFVITVPSPVVDKVLAVLKSARLIHGMALEEHYGFNISTTPNLFCATGLRLIRHERFQFGLNNLFVFGKDP